MDEYEIRYSEVLLDLILRAMEIAKEQHAFGAVDPFLAIWISDSGHRIMYDSVRRLNGPEVAAAFRAELGEGDD